MAKVSPVMQHVKPKLTAEQIAIEDFMQSIPPQVVIEGDTIIDNTIPEMIVQEDTSLDPIVEAAVAADQLDELAEDVDGITTAASMESYKRLFNQLTTATGHPVTSLENYPATKGGVRKFAKAIRDHANDIRYCVSIALEDYAGKIDEKIGTTVSNYKQALGELAQVKEDDFNVDGKITIDHKHVWQLFHMNGKLMDLRDFHKEVEAIKELTKHIREGKDNILKWAKGEDSKGDALDSMGSISLMNNIKVEIADGRAEWDKIPAPKPDKSWTAGDYFWIFMFSWAGLVYRLIHGGSGDEKTKKTQSLKAIHKVVDEMKRLAPLVQEIENDAKAIISAIDGAQEDRKTDLKRAASPVLELAAKTIQHVTEVTYGAKKMFNYAEK